MPCASFNKKVKVLLGTEGKRTAAPARCLRSAPRSPIAAGAWAGEASAIVLAGRRAQAIVAAEIEAQRLPMGQLDGIEMVAA